MTRALCLTTLILSLFSLFNFSYKFLKPNDTHNEYSLLATPLNWFSPLSSSFHSASFLIGVAVLLCGLFLYHLKSVRILCFTVYFFNVSILMSNGKIDHDLHALLFVSFFCCFYKVNDSLTSTWNINTLRLTQGTLLFHYFLSGVWKLRSFLMGDNIDLQAVALKPFAIAVAEGNVQSNPIMLYLTNNVALLKLGFILVLIFQISCIIPIYLKKYFKLWAIAAIAFHVSTEISLGIRFNFTRLAVLVALILFDEFLSLEKGIDKRSDRACFGKENKQTQ